MSRSRCRRTQHSDFVVAVQDIEILGPEATQTIKGHLGMQIFQKSNVKTVLGECVKLYFVVNGAHTKSAPKSYETCVLRNLSSLIPRLDVPKHPNLQFVTKSQKGRPCPFQIEKASLTSTVPYPYPRHCKNPQPEIARKKGQF